jgi:hypothetical protein
MKIDINNKSKNGERLVQISAGQKTLEGNLIIPKSSRGRKISCPLLQQEII